MPLSCGYIDVHKLDAMVRWEAASPVLSPGVAPALCSGIFYGRISRDAVEGMMEIQRDVDGRAVWLAVWA